MQTKLDYSGRLSGPGAFGRLGAHEPEVRLPLPTTLPLALPPLPTKPSVPPLFDRVQLLLSGDTEMWRRIADAAGGLAVNLALAAMIFAGTVWASRWLSRVAAEAIARAHRHKPPDTTLQSFASSSVRYFVVVVGLIAVLQQLGMKTTSVIAVLGAASLAIGLALQGALANVAAGVMLLILRPYRVGDRVDISGKSGIVKGLDLFSTRLSDLDNLNVFVPNGKAFGEIIVNHTSTPSRRIEISVGIDYQDDLDLALRELLACAAQEPGVLKSPEPWAKLTALEDSSVTVTLRVWVAPKDYLEARFDLLRAIKDRFDAVGLHFPYPHQVSVEGRPFEPAGPQPPTAVARPAATPKARGPEAGTRAEG